MQSRCRSLIHHRAALPAFSSARGAVARPSSRLSCSGTRPFHAAVTPWQGVTPLRKKLKDTSKAARAAKRASGEDAAVIDQDQVEGWELTVGIEIHAQLNTARKLFSDALTDPSLEPNSRVEQFDLALPGSQPIFQHATLIPAIRAATALGCNIQPESRFDRKHYFYHDQPSGYQITQYYHPFAKDGVVILDSHDGLEPGEELAIGIKQVQLEQDTARTQDQDSETSLVDFNRAGHPLIEIISLPQLHSPRIAAAYVKKVQAILFSVDAVTTGMELGGLRADVNVSVRRAGTVSEYGLSYGGVSGLGQRTEIKNLSTFKGIEDAIIAERDRQIDVLETGGVVEGETRGWSVTKPGTTRRLRGKEGEVDYRYMPDPDLAPLYISQDLIQHLDTYLPPVPDALAIMLRKDHGLSEVDAWTLLALDDGTRLIYFQEVLDNLVQLNPGSTVTHRRDFSKVTANWVLHELGFLLTQHEKEWTKDLVPADRLAYILHLLRKEEITNTAAKRLLKLIFEGDRRPVAEIVDSEGLRFVAMSSEQYQELADQVIANFPDHVRDIKEKGLQTKIKFLLGQMMRHGDKGSVQAREALAHLKKKLFGDQSR